MGYKPNIQQMRRLNFLCKNVIFFLFFLISFSVASQEMKTLSPDEAFKVSGEIESKASVLILYTIEDGYYLYKSKFSFKINDGEYEVGEPLFSESMLHNDEFFGDVEIYRERATIRLSNLDLSVGRIVIQIIAQGCADHGICFLPFSQKLSMYWF
ncbi:MAG: hypothetical protein CMK56_00420 [Proteobacteria bacterium]|nr:hypothetical protein [Pseudomonadota bacterium]